MAVCLPTADDEMQQHFRVPKPYGCSNDNLQPSAAQGNYFTLKCVGLALVQKAFCRTSRRGNAILFKVLDIGCLFYILPCKPATKFRF